MTFDELFQDAVAPAFDKQLTLGDVVSSADWQIILSEGKLIFGNQHTFAIQVIGTESHHDNTWLWGWANEASQLPPAVLQDGRQLHAFGQQQGIPDLTQSLLAISPTLDGHHIASVASFLCHADAYYRCPYDGGALFVTIHDSALTPPDIEPVLHITTVFPQVISAYAITNQRRALTSYMRSITWLSLRARRHSPALMRGATRSARPLMRWDVSAPWLWMPKGVNDEVSTPEARGSQGAFKVAIKAGS